MFRPDFPVVRHLATRFGAPLAVAWQELPYLLLPGEGFTEYAIAYQAELAQAMPTLAHLPWEEAIFDFPTGLLPLMKAGLHAAFDHLQLGEEYLHLTTPQESNRGRCWMRVVDGPRYLHEAARCSPWLAGDLDLLAPFRANPETWFALEVWEERTQTPGQEGGLPPYPDISIIPKTDCWHYPRQAHLYPNLRCREGRVYGDGHGFCTYARCPYQADTWRTHPCAQSNLVMGSGVVLLLSTLAYLLGMDEYLVEVSPVRTPRQVRQRAKHEGKGDSKPWTRDDLSHYILIDPHRTHEYGQPRGEATGAGTPHRPHQRRGHWRQLRADRFEREVDGSPRTIWIKPAWIGEMSWTAEGQRYRVVPPV